MIPLRGENVLPYKLHFLHPPLMEGMTPSPALSYGLDSSCI